jgi:hypothetical protein
MSKLNLLTFLLIGVFTISCVDNPRKIIKEELDKSSLTKVNDIKITYERFAITQLNSNDFSWKFLEEYKELGTITFNSEDKMISIDSPKLARIIFKINKIQKSERGYIATANKNNIIIIAIEYNRIAIGIEEKDIFSMFIFKDEDREKINNSLLKML